MRAAAGTNAALEINWSQLLPAKGGGTSGGEVKLTKTTLIAAGAVFVAALGTTLPESLALACKRRMPLPYMFLYSDARFAGGREIFVHARAHWLPARGRGLLVLADHRHQVHMFVGVLLCFIEPKVGGMGPGASSLRDCKPGDLDPSTPLHLSSVVGSTGTPLLL